MDESGPSKAKWYRQSFCKAWLKDKEFSEWLVENTDGHPTCKVCDFKFKDANKGGLLRHKNTEKHNKAMASKKQALTLKTFFKPKPQETSSLDMMTAKAELIMTAFMAEHRTPFLQADHLSKACASMFPDSKIAANMKIKRTKASYVMQDGIAHAEKESISSMCTAQKFSILIDESTDVSVTQVLAVVVRFLQGSIVKDALLDIVEVEDGSSETLFNSVKSLLQKNKIPITNIVGFAADNCATMMGRHSGFQARLKAEVPNVFVLGCVCHSFALCASHASEKLPSWLESFLKDISSYFSRSSKRQREFDLIQRAVKAEDHQMLKLSQTRWLSRGQVVARILEQWEALRLFFQSQVSVDKVDGAATIFNTMNNAGTKHMLLFLNYILPKVDRMNQHFQSEQPRIHTLFIDISSLYKELLSFFIKDDILHSRDLGNIDPSDSTLHRPTSEIILGGRCLAELIRTALGNNENKFREDCLKFLIELCNQIRARFDFSKTSTLAAMSALDPKVALSTSRPIPSLVPLASMFPQIVVDEEYDALDDEWRNLLNCKPQLKLSELKPVGEFWSEIESVKDGMDVPKFPLLGRLMCTLAVLPHSSACVERVFSEVNMTKTPLTNRLQSSTVANRLLARQYLTRNTQECFTWSPEQKLVDAVQSGLCYQRYLDRTGQKNPNRDNVTFYEDVDDTEFVDGSSTNSD